MSASKNGSSKTGGYTRVKNKTDKIQKSQKTKQKEQRKEKEFQAYSKGVKNQLLQKVTIPSRPSSNLPLQRGANVGNTNDEIIEDDVELSVSSRRRPHVSTKTQLQHLLSPDDEDAYGEEELSVSTTKTTTKTRTRSNIMDDGENPGAPKAPRAKTPKQVKNDVTSKGKGKYTILNMDSTGLIPRMFIDGWEDAKSAIDFRFEIREAAPEDTNCDFCKKPLKQVEKIQIFDNIFLHGDCISLFSKFGEK